MMQLKTADRLNGIGEYYFSQKLREIDALNKEGKAIINLGIGSPDLPPHPDVIKTLQEEAAKPNVHAYQSYKGSPVLRKAMANWYATWYGVELNPDTEILPLIGSKEGIMHICMTYLNTGDQALIPNPGYPTYSSAVKLAGGEPVSYELVESLNWEPDLDALDKTDLSKVKLMWVNYPHMPTGQVPSAEFYARLIKFAKKNQILICHDNPYSFILNEQPVSLLAVPGAMEVVVELNSLSKSQNMAGWRIGMLAGAKDRIDEVIRFKSNMDSGMFLPAQLAAAKALQLGADWYASVNDVYRRRRKLVFELLNELNATYNPEQVGMFVWAKIPEQYKDGFEMSDAILYGANVFITPGGIFGNAGNGFIRVSLCSPEEKLIEAMERIQKNSGGWKKG
ncbi:aminotransferase class I/II-fold pyridoxal phosphate-dependent enzyme [Flavihumibacter cheonanensis]|uniref:pyridoxal phosphate-dependent aminotransferase n=1 Tax=Flavihumibacter cheonanensis TaxID=1442385 RepID=UPI001EF985F2|nr:aminotransferase class I/II-fold pyridoxal phosphate-dependent enzyme [Flavihumibacter cheonanensis]MCG7752091.1 aminotransferase class I/II-fold pyridoxal phosphate-dependent enzyme [Flavihumibacter cheonanensis]